MARIMKTVPELASTPQFIPPWVAGDRDFHGNGPRINLRAQISIRNGNELWANVSMRAKETKKDWTEASGSANYLVFKDPNITQIYRIVSDTISSHTYVDEGHRPDVRTMHDPGELVNRFECVGDTTGDEAGIRTGVKVYFNPVILDVEELDQPIVTPIQVPPSTWFVPHHTNGDHDFHGNGPRVYVWASIEVRNSYEIWATIGMYARETKKDWTEAEGYMTYMLYQHDRPIVSIESDTFSSYRYTDTNHSVESFDMSPLELVKTFECVGDTGGDEAGIRTGVKVYFNPILIRDS